MRCLLSFRSFSPSSRSVGLCASLLLCLALSTFAQQQPKLDGHWQLDQKATTGLYGPFALPDLQLDIQSDKQVDLYHITIHSPANSWTMQDTYRIDGQNQNVAFVGPQKQKLSGIRQLRWSPDRKFILGQENLQTASMFGTVKISRQLKMYIDDRQRLVVDSQESSPLGVHSVHSVYVKGKAPVAKSTPLPE